MRLVQRSQVVLTLFPEGDSQINFARNVLLKDLTVFLYFQEQAFEGKNFQLLQAHLLLTSEGL